MHFLSEYQQCTHMELMQMEGQFVDDFVLVDLAGIEIEVKTEVTCQGLIESSAYQHSTLLFKRRDHCFISEKLLFPYVNNNSCYSFRT